MATRNCSNIKTGRRLSERLFQAACPPVTLAAAILTVLFLFSCTDAALNLDDEYLIRVRERVVTVSDFNKTFEITKSAYPHNLSQDSVLLKEAQVRMLNQMIEELLVLQRAAELQIVLTEPEVAQAIADIKTDYPEGVFEQMLLEYAVSYSFWEKRLKIRLMMEKVVEREVHRNITLTPEEIAKFYKENYEGKQPASGQDAEKTNINRLIVQLLRRQKAEEAYQLWIKNLRGKYTVDINQSQWKRLTGL
jgi:parvulin-like peptidyl-prolyl isomerase